MERLCEKGPLSYPCSIFILLLNFNKVLVEGSIKIVTVVINVLCEIDGQLSEFLDTVTNFNSYYANYLNCLIGKVTDIRMNIQILVVTFTFILDILVKMKIFYGD